MSLFESVTRTKVKDCFVDDNEVLTYVVEENMIGKAIGKKAVNVKKLERMLSRKIKIVEFNPSLVQFVKNLFAPVSATEVKQDGKNVTVSAETTQAKAIIIGRSGRNLRNAESIVKKYFDIEKISVI